MLEALPVLVREKRRRDRLSCRAAGGASGVGFNTVSRVERGEHCSLENALALLRWVGAPDCTGHCVTPAVTPAVTPSVTTTEENL